ncbi:MAG: hypothetical protein ABFS05_00805 [Bacteroidota bacterium]
MKLNKEKGLVSRLTLIAIIILISSIKISNPQRNILSWDAFGNYLYLPATFIYGDPAIKDMKWVENINEKYNNTETFYQLASKRGGRHVIRFTSGMAWMMSPFFMMGHAFASAAVIYEADGFSKPYQWAIILGGIFYFIIGLIFLRKILLKFLSDKVTAITLAILCISSNLYFFITYGNDIPHVYVFVLNVFIVWLTMRWHEDHQKKHAILLGAVLGLAVLTRVSEVVMASIPLLWGIYDKKSLIRKWNMIIEYRKQVGIIALSGVIAILPQLAYWLVATGDIFYFAYDDASSSLNLFNPRFGWVLFGFRKGFFIYSPIMILSVIGFYHLYKRKKELFFPLLAAVFFHTYLIACFSSLIAYGWRAFIDIYSLLVIPLAFFIARVEASKLWMRIPVYLVILAITVLNLFQVWQLNHGILDGYRMTKAYYMRVLGKTKVTEEDRKLMLVQRNYTSVEYLSNEEDFDHKVIQHFDFETPEKDHADHYDTTYAYTGERSFRMDGSVEFSPTLRKEYREISDNYYGWVRASVWVYPTADPESNHASLVMSFRHDWDNYKYRRYRMTADTVHLQLNQWNLITADYMTPELISRSDKLEVYVWYEGEEDIWIDDLKIEFFDPKY